MITRILPESEWPKLIGTEAEAVWPHLDPGKSQVIVVEDGDQIVGTWTLMYVLHAECLWIAPSHRKGASVGRRLLSALHAMAKKMDVGTVATAAQTDDVRAMLDHIGAQKLVGDHYVMRMPCQQQ